MNVLFSTAPCVFGLVLVARNERGVCAIMLGDEAGALARELREAFPQAMPGTGNEFQQRVWRALREIPAGSTRSYGEIAERLGAPRAAKEVGEACAANVLAVACSEGVRVTDTADLFE